MFANINPVQLTVGYQAVSRRSALLGLGSLGAMAAFTVRTAGAAATEPAASATRKSLNLDFTRPEDNLTAWIKLVSSLEGGTETCGFFSGTQYGNTDPQEVIQPLFRIQGFGMSRVTRMPDGRYQNLHREVVYYLDLKEDRILDQWKNPYTGETVEVFHTHNDPVNSYYATRFKQRFGSPDAGIKEVEFPFILPWETFGDRVAVSFAVNTRWPTPLPPKKWPREHFGDWYRTSEYFQIHASLADLNNPDKLKVPTTGAWQKVAPWHPWDAHGQPARWHLQRDQCVLAGQHGPATEACARVHREEVAEVSARAHRVGRAQYDHLGDLRHRAHAGAGEEDVADELRRLNTGVRANRRSRGRPGRLEHIRIHCQHPGLGAEVQALDDRPRAGGAKGDEQGQEVFFRRVGTLCLRGLAAPVHQPFFG